MADSLKYRLTSGKPSKGSYYVRNVLKKLVPGCVYRMMAKRMLKRLESHPDKAYILDRVNYYNTLNAPFELPAETWHERNGGIYHFLDRIDQFKLSTFHSK